jgi:hypothetical protein
LMKEGHIEDVAVGFQYGVLVQIASLKVE